MLSILTPVVVSTVLCTLAEPTPPAVTPVDTAAGWKLYSGPDAAKQWRGFKQSGFPAKGWTVANGALSHAAGAGGGDIITADQFGDFEIACQFKLAPKANSGIIFRVAEKHDATWQTGPEFQVFEDTTAGAKPTDPHSAGALYDLYPPGPGKVLRPAGQLNDARIWLRNGVLQHWLNGVKLVDVVIFDDSGKPTPEWLAKIAASKFKEYEGFGVQPRGHIALQDHGDEVLYSDIRIRDLGAAMPGEKVLFNGKDLTGWMPVVPDLIAKQQDPAQVWEIKDGVMICKGNPVGYIRTTDKYTNFVLKLQWRFNPVTKKAGNSGVLLRMVGDEKVWPKSVEAQLQSGSAGDFWNIDNVKMKVDPARTKGRNTKATHTAERPVGEWNDYEIIVNKGDIILKVNGEELNRATEVEEVPGYICLQSEGAEIQFRDIRVVPLP